MRTFTVTIHEEVTYAHEYSEADLAELGVDVADLDDSTAVSAILENPRVEEDLQRYGDVEGSSWTVTPNDVERMSDMPSPEADALDRIAAAMTEDNGPWPRAASHDCGVCDGPLRPTENPEWWTCSACGSAHTSRDCCESRFERIAAILRETGRL